MVTQVTTNPQIEGVKMELLNPPKCFLLMRSEKDMQGLLEYGKVIIIHGGERRPSFWSPAFVECTYEKLEEFGYRHGIDYMVAAGPLVPLIKTLCGLTKRHGSEPRLLVFDATRQGFVIG